MRCRTRVIWLVTSLFSASAYAQGRATPGGLSRQAGPRRRRFLSRRWRRYPREHCHQRLNESLGQPIVIDNRGGAGGAIACGIVAKAPPDGYTVLIASVGMLAINPALFPKLPYAPLKDFAPVTLFAESPYVLVTHPEVAARSVKELVAPGTPCSCPPRPPGRSSPA